MGCANRNPSDADTERVEYPKLDASYEHDRNVTLVRALHQFRQDAEMSQLEVHSPHCPIQTQVADLLPDDDIECVEMGEIDLRQCGCQPLHLTRAAVDFESTQALSKRYHDWWRSQATH